MRQGLPSEYPVVEMTRIDLDSLENLVMSLKRMALDRVRAGTCLKQALSLLGNMAIDTTCLPESFDGDCRAVIDICALTVQVLCVAYLSYTQGHVGVLTPFFIEHSINKVQLCGSRHPSSGPVIILELMKLSCMHDMLQDHVLCLSLAQPSKNVAF